MAKELAEPGCYGDRMALVAGVDGIKGGWVFVLKEGAEITLRKAASFPELLRMTEAATAVAVDIPIGLLKAACRGGREARFV